MSGLVVVGTQWGDEGKGKIIDLLAERVDVVARYQGGHNAGHTIVLGGDRFVVHLVPSGIFHPGKVCVIGNGVVVDPAALLEEVQLLRERGIAMEGRLFVSSRAHLILPYHKAIDKESEKLRGIRRIGTTGRGIGPAYVDKMARVGIQVGDLLDADLFREKLQANLLEMNYLMEHRYEIPRFELEEIFETYRGYGKAVASYVADTGLLLHRALKEGKRVLFEGAQGTLLDVDFGTYPYVTSSSACAGGASTGTGVSPLALTGVLGVAKAYTTRVGSGPFPTELRDALGELFRERGGEYGATTGRPRRCGWFDAVAVRYAARINGLTGLALTKLDVLDSSETVRVCVAYRLRGETVGEFVGSARDLERCEPVYEDLPGWKDSTRGIETFDRLPSAAQRFVRHLEALVGVPVQLISTGARRDEVIEISDPLKTAR